MQKHVLLYEDVIENLYRLIDEKALRPGDMFPSERILVQEWEVSRNVLREGFHILEQRGIIVSRQGKGRFLRQIPKQGIEENGENVAKMLERYSLREIYQVRQLLESKASRMAAEKADENDIRDLWECYNRMRIRFQETNSTEGEFAMHRMYLIKSGNQYLRQTSEDAWQKVQDMMTNTFREILKAHHVQEALKAHQAIINAIAAHDAEMAEKQMWDHIQETIDML